MKRLSGCVLSLLLMCGTANAQPDDSLRQQRIDEVVVKGQAAERRINDLQTGVEKVDVATMSQLPALLGERDIVKSLQLLPGVKQEGDGLGGYQVRGGTSAQNSILLDGAAVYNVGHLVGLFSAFNDDVLGNVDLYKGLMPARLGGGSSSVLNMTMRNGDATRHHFSTTVGLLSAKAEADGPMDGRGSTYLVAGRTSFLDLFIKGTQDYTRNTLRFYDLNTRLQFRLGERDQLSLSLFRSYDNIDIEKMMRMVWSNTTGSLGWLHSRSNGSYAHTQLAASNYESTEGVDIYSFNVNMLGYCRQLTLRHNQTWPLGRHHTLDAGGETTLMGLQTGDWHIVSSYEREKRDMWLSALWVQDDMTLFADRLLLSAGLRCDWVSPLGGKPYYRLDDAGNIIDTFHPKKWSTVKTYTIVQPRLSLTWKVGRLLALKAGYSRLAQAVQPVRNSSMTLPIDRMAFSSNNIRPQVSSQVAAGFSVATPGGTWDFAADAYYKKLKNVYDYREGKVFNADIEIERLITGGRGRAYGLELSAHKNKGWLTGWAAYTLSWVENQIDGIMANQWYTAANDRRHDLVAVLLAKVSSRWTLTSTWRYTTGQAMTAPSQKFEIDGETWYYYGPRNSTRAPAYHRLDLSAAYTTTKGKATRTWAFGLFNAYNRYNPFFVSFREGEGEGQSQEGESGLPEGKASGTKAVVTSLFGIVPTVSFTYKF